MAVGGIDQRLQVVRRAIGIVRRIGQHAVIAPAAPAREMGDGHDLDGGDAEMGKVRQALDGGAEGAFRREGADVQFVEHGLLPRPALPADIAPGIAPVVDDHRRSVDIVPLRMGGGIGNFCAVGKAEPVGRAGASLVRFHLVPAVPRRVHRDIPVAGNELDGRFGGRPEAELHPAVFQHAWSPALRDRRRSCHRLPLLRLPGSNREEGAIVPEQCAAFRVAPPLFTTPSETAARAFRLSFTQGDPPA